MMEIRSYLASAFPKMKRKFTQENLLPFAEIMAMYAKELSPHKTGHNRDSIRLDPRHPTEETEEIAIVTESGYGGWLEIGTARRPATPYFQPAFDRTKEDMGL